MKEFEYDEEYIDEKFDRAIKYIPTIVGLLDSSTKLGFYGYFKQATVGCCNIPKPGFLNFEAKSKWEAWNKLKDMDQTQAKHLYIEKLDEIEPNWYKKNIKGNIYVSRPLFEDDDKLESEKTIFDFVREGNLDSLKKAIEDDRLNLAKKENGLYLIHWACDRGDYEIVKYLLEMGSDVNLLDEEDGLSPLIYAAAGNHAEIVKLLLRQNPGPNLSLTDEDGLTAIELTSDSYIKSLLSEYAKSES